MVGCRDGNTADVGEKKVGRMLCDVISGGGYTFCETHRYTRHEWEEALAYRPTVLKIQGLECGAAFRLT